MRKIYLVAVSIIILFVMFSLSFVSAALTYSEQWSWNLTGMPANPAIAFGDIDNDGDLDLLTIGCAFGTHDGTCNTFEKSRVYINNGTSLVENETWQQNLSSSFKSLTLGDIDNDGDLDLIITNMQKVYINNGTTFTENSAWQQELVTYDATPGSVGLGDIDNDGDLDLVFTCFGSNDPSAYINNGTSFVGEYWIDNSLWNCRESVYLIDIDNDDYLDLISAGNNYGGLFINNGSAFTAIDAYIISMDHVSSVAGDLDNDGDIDLIEMGYAAGPASRGLKNNGTTLVRNTLWEIAGQARGSLSVGDYDNDGDLDLLAIGGNYVDVYDNNGTTLIANATTSANLIANSGTSTAWIDIDNDNDLDLVIVYGGAIWIYINNITTSNTPPTSPASFSNSYSNREIKLGWGNGSDAETNSSGLYYNLMIGNSTANHTIISGVYGGSSNPTAGYFGNMMQRKNLTLKVDRLQSATTYYWYVQTIDTALKAGNWSARQSFNTPADMTRPNITLNSPVDGYNSSSYTITFNVTVADANLTNVSLWGNWSANGWHLNETNTTGINGTYIFEKNLTAYGDGSYTWMISARDNSTNLQNSSIRTFLIDTINPNINIITPENNTNSTENGLDINYTVSDANLESCWYSNDTYAGNESLTCGDNITSVAWAEGQHNITIWANDSAGNENSSSVSFMIDSINPAINITYPINNITYSVNTLDINYTISDANLQSCWYSNDTYSGNVTLTGCANITSVAWAEGQHNVTIYANDTFGNINNSKVVFRVDTIAPAINITSPVNNTNSTDNILDVKYTVSDANLESCWYSNDTYAGNESLTCGDNITSVAWAEGQHNVTIWANDTIGNKSSSSITFMIDTIAPAINITSPVNNTNSTENGLDINYTVSDANLQSCWYSNDTYSGNVTLTGCANITLVIWAEGQHNVTIYVNDSFGNKNSSFVRFTIDTNAPIINLISPANGSSWTSSSTVIFSYNVSDVGIANCSLIINNSVDQTDNSVGEDTTQTFTKSLSNADYNWSVNCTDYVGYTNKSSSYSLTVSYIAPANGGNGGNGGGGGTTTTYWTSTYIIKDEQLAEGYTKELSVKQRLKISINKTEHYVGVVKLTNESVIVNITSSPQQAVLFINQTKKFDVAGDGFYDLLVRLNNITENKANLTIMKIYEKILDVEVGGAEEEKPEEVGEEKREAEGEEEKEKRKLWLWIVVIIIMVIISLIIFFITKFLKRYIKYRHWKKYTLFK